MSRIKTVLTVPEITMKWAMAYGYLPFEVEAWAWISITSPSGTRLTKSKERKSLQPKLKYWLQLEFEDIDPVFDGEYYLKHKNQFELFTKNHAKIIVDFVDKVKGKVDLLIVNCEAGISRSGAVGEWLCDYLGLDYAEFRNQNRLIMPNSYVLTKLKRASGDGSGWCKFLI